MNYKNIMLGILLIPSATFAQTSLEKLKQQRYEKLLEIDKIAQEITENYRKIMKIYELYNIVLSRNTTKRLNNMENPIPEAEMRDIIINENANISVHVQDALAGKHLLDNNVMDNVYLDDTPMSFSTDRFLETSVLIDFLLIKEAMEKYKKAFTELVIITHQIHALQ